ncbi:MAG TPA: hypothetical protein ENN30_00875 [Candidatus Woesearchaeota archaeon]|nr:hypothetical protein [Candidatus Woesearchaeota archaeon]
MIKFNLDQGRLDKLKKAAERQLPGISFLFNNKQVVFADGKKTEVYLVSEEVYKVFKKASENRAPYSLGFYFGEWGREIVFSFGALQEYVNKKDSKKVMIYPKAEQKFLFGRNLSVRKIWKYDEKIKKGDLVIVTTNKNEALGFGDAEIDFSKIEDCSDETRAVNTKSEIGWYLRHN